jgi:hypothetical protein
VKLTPLIDASRMQQTDSKGLFGRQNSTPAGGPVEVDLVISHLNSTPGLKGYNGLQPFEACPNQGPKVDMDSPIRVICRQPGLRYLPVLRITVARNSPCGSVFLITPRQAQDGKSPALCCYNTHWSTRNNSAPNYVLQALEEILGCPCTDWSAVYEEDPSLKCHPRPIAASKYFRLVVYQVGVALSAEKRAVFEAARGAYHNSGYYTIILAASSKKEEICKRLLEALQRAGLEPKISQNDLLSYMNRMGDECLFLEKREPFAH